MLAVLAQDRLCAFLKSSQSSSGAFVQQSVAVCVQRTFGWPAHSKIEGTIEASLQVMDNAQASSSEPAFSPEAEIRALARSVRRLTRAVWCLLGLLVLTFAAPWIMYLVGPTSRVTTRQVTTSGRPAEAPLPYEPSFDNDFHARKPEEQIKRATVILVTRIQKDQGEHKAVISEIVKRGPKIRFYYAVGDEYGEMSHLPASNCEGCEGEGQVVFLLGNPATMAASYGYRDGRIDSFGGMFTLDDLARQRLTAAREWRALPRRQHARRRRPRCHGLMAAKVEKIVDDYVATKYARKG